MEKDVKIIFCLSLVLILSLSLVSAGWFSDFFGKITGQATSECSLLGDVNYDGVLDCKDVALIIEMDAELIPIDLCGDFSKNGYVSSYDSALLMKDYNLPCSGCISQTCELLNKQCGSWEGGCGTILNCGNCETNYQCEEGICVENPCPLKGDVNYDGVLDCEDVVLIQQMDAELIEPDLCGDISNNDKVTSSDASLLMTQIGNNCEGCHPLTCSDLVKQCGSWSDGCEGTLNCGDCGTDYKCVTGRCEKQSTCKIGDVNYNGVLDCNDAELIQKMVVGTIAQDLCGDMSGNGYLSSYDASLLKTKNNLSCENCVPRTCSLLGKSKCGSWSDGCGVNLNCGICEAGKICVSDNDCPDETQICFGGIEDEKICVEKEFCFGEGNCNLFENKTSCLSANCLWNIKCDLDNVCESGQCVNGLCVMGTNISDITISLFTSKDIYSVGEKIELI